MDESRSHLPDDIDRLVDRQIDESIDARSSPEADAQRAELELQLEIDAALKRLIRPEASMSEVDLVIDRAIESGAAPVSADPDVRLQVQIDAALRRQFGSDAPAVPIRRRPRWQGLAAAVLLLASGAILYSTGYAGRAWSWAADVMFPETLASLYHDHVSSGVVMANCETPEAFQAWVGANYREQVRPVGAEGLTFVGWSYDDAISRYSGVMLGKALGEDVVVLVDRVERDREMTVPSGSGLRLFRREVGEVVFYELTPLEEPVFIGTFELVEGAG
jgi:hypothetical protein